VEGDAHVARERFSVIAGSLPGHEAGPPSLPMPRCCTNGLKRGPCQGGGKALFLTRPRVPVAHPFVSAWGCRCRACDCAEHATGCRPDGCTGTATSGSHTGPMAARSPTRRA
jgi:hypothetical protein